MASLFKSTTTYDPIFALLNAETVEERDKLTEKWRNHKLEELNFIGVVGALLAGCLTSTGSWPTILPTGVLQPWTVRACWYCGVILALSSVLVAASQSIRLHRLSSHRRANTNIRRLLSRQNRCQTTGKILPRRAQVYSWQLSALFLWLSVLAMIGGMFILIWSSTGGYGVTRTEWWNNEAKLAVTFTTVFVGIVFLFGMEQVTLYSWEGGDDADPDREEHEQQRRARSDEG